MTRWREWAEAEGEGIRSAGRWRQVRSLDSRGPMGTTAEGAKVVAFASNDYLGLTGHPEVTRAAIEAVERWGSGSGAVACSFSWYIAHFSPKSKPYGDPKAVFRSCRHYNFVTPG